MHRIARLGPVAIAMLALAASACGSGAEDVPRNPAGPVDDTALATGVNEFGFDLLSVAPAYDEGGSENTAYSPLSMAMAFGMAEAGARGETSEQIADVFHFPDTDADLHAAFNSLDQGVSHAPSKALTVQVANRIYPAETFDVLPEFSKTLAADYGAPVERLDFASDPEKARAQINEWVSDRTQKLIPAAFGDGSITNETVLVLVNALYLKARWRSTFGASPTETKPFTTLDGSTQDVKLMHEEALETTYVDGDGFQAVEIPYQKALSMLVLLPEQDSFEEFAEDLDTERLAKIDAAMQRGNVDLYLPMWKGGSSLDLTAVLAKLGLTLPFGSDADFSGIASDAPPIGTAIHAAKIDVDDWGTVAAAITGIGYMTSGPPPADVTIRADHPFYYVIRDKDTGVALFIGRVVAP